MTYSIVARDPDTGEMGVAVQSHYFTVGPIVPWLRAGVGAVATQSFVEPAYGLRGLARMAAGDAAPAALAGAGRRRRGARRAAGGDGRHRRAGRRAHRREVHRRRRPPGRRRVLRAGQHDAQRDGARRDVRGVLVVHGAARGAAGRGAGGGRGRGRRHPRAPVGGDQDRPRRRPATTRGTTWCSTCASTTTPTRTPSSRGSSACTAPTPSSGGPRRCGSSRRRPRRTREAEAALALLPESIELGFWHGVQLCIDGRDAEARPLLDRAYAVDGGWRELVRRLPAAGLLADDPALVSRILGDGSG